VVKQFARPYRASEAVDQYIHLDLRFVDFFTELYPFLLAAFQDRFRSPFGIQASVTARRRIAASRTGTESLTRNFSSCPHSLDVSVAVRTIPIGTEGTFDRSDTRGVVVPPSGDRRVPSGDQGKYEYVSSHWL